MVPGAKFSTTIWAEDTRLRRIPLPASEPRSNVKLFLDVFKYRNHAPDSVRPSPSGRGVGVRALAKGPNRRMGSPEPGRSILITSAPKVAINLVQ